MSDQYKQWEEKSKTKYNKINKMFGHVESNLRISLGLNI